MGYIDAYILVSVDVVIVSCFFCIYIIILLSFCCGWKRDLLIGGG